MHEGRIFIPVEIRTRKRPRELLATLDGCRPIDELDSQTRYQRLRRDTLTLAGTEGDVHVQTDGLARLERRGEDVYKSRLAKSVAVILANIKPAKAVVVEREELETACSEVFQGAHIITDGLVVDICIREPKHSQ